MSRKERSAFDFSYLVNIIWLNKLTILVVLIMALYFGVDKIKKSTPLYDSSVVFEVSQSTSSRSENAAAALLLMQGQEAKKDVPIILGRKFLKKILEIKEVKAAINQHCNTSFQKPSILSIYGLLDYFGYYTLKVPTDEQMKETLIGCIRQMIYIEEYAYKDLRTDARKLTIKSSDQNFSAMLANNLVRSYLIYTNQKKNETYKDFLKILNDEIEKLELKTKKKQTGLNNFVLENAVVFGGIQRNFKALENQNPYLTSLMANITTDLQSISDLEGKLYEIDKSLDLLIEVTDEKALNNMLKNYLDFSFSSDFEKKMGRFYSNMPLTNSSENELKKIIEVEKGRLEDLRQNLKQSISKFEENINKNTLINSEITNFVFDIEQMKQRLIKLTGIYTDVSLEANYESRDQRNIHTSAVPAINPSSPKTTLILISVLGLGIIFAFGLIIVKQTIFQIIYSPQQVSKRFKFLDVLKIGSKKINKSKEILASSSQPEREELVLASRIEKSGVKIIFLEIGNGLTYGSSVVDRLSLYFSRVLTFKPIKLLLINRTQNINPEFLQKEFKKEMPNSGSFEASNDELKKIEENTLFPLEQKYDQYDNIIISIDKNFGNVEKFALIDQCDKFVLVSKIGKVRLNDFSVFFEGSESDLREKCLGLVLIK